LTIEKASDDWVECYRRQEAERYKFPKKPWVYYNEDGSTSIVGPVVKKNASQTNQKPREHHVLHPRRPPLVTLLCLARDAASRMPDGIGTKADILELLK
jgi:nuclear factor related to kappa-B-binding protein